MYVDALLQDGLAGTLLSIAERSNALSMSALRVLNGISRVPESPAADILTYHGGASLLTAMLTQPGGFERSEDGARYVTQIPEGGLAPPPLTHEIARQEAIAELLETVMSRSAAGTEQV
jgi:hypothetical protein